MTITLAVLREHRDALAAKFGRDACIAYDNVSMTQLSIARFAGGATVNGARYTYNPADDSLIREDVVKWLTRRLKKAKKEAADADK